MDRKHYAIVAFPTSQAAAAAEIHVSDSAFDCRLIPMPEQIAAGCGLVLQLPVEDVKAVQSILEKNRIAVDEYYEVHFINRKKSVDVLER
ncbi:MAG: DUF3343 domain-containing protein [Pisciglobus halotolerans]|nr:DUF3343 domain-containing protein [Pisciglobus halotolerans]